LQLLLGPEEEDVFPSEEAELDELELSAWAAQATAAARVMAATDNVGFLIGDSPQW
jgi:hypothetical protein